MLTKEELEAIFTSIDDAISDDPKPDWKYSLGDALVLIGHAITKHELQEAGIPLSDLRAIVAWSAERIANKGGE
tara:strand:+ start:1877 stop:2098 length:222 start_codon:yes stop_codon:yes gene_type:complete